VLTFFPFQAPVVVCAESQ